MPPYACNAWRNVGAAECIEFIPFCATFITTALMLQSARIRWGHHDDKAKHNTHTRSLVLPKRFDIKTSRTSYSKPIPIPAGGTFVLLLVIEAGPPPYFALGTGLGVLLVGLGPPPAPRLQTRTCTAPHLVHELAPRVVHEVCHSGLTLTCGGLRCCLMADHAVVRYKLNVNANFETGFSLYRFKG
jgi:hypothetical protein